MYCCFLFPSVAFYSHSSRIFRGYPVKVHELDESFLCCLRVCYSGVCIIAPSTASSSPSPFVFLTLLPHTYSPPTSHFLSTQTSAGTGLKTRHFNNIISELTASLRIHTECDSRLGGVSLEFTGELNEEGYSVTECLGGSMELGEEELGLRYQVGFFLLFFSLFAFCALWGWVGFGWLVVNVG